MLTGASGFIGMKLIPLLKQKGFRVLALVSPKTDRNKIESIKMHSASCFYVDIRDYHQLRSKVVESPDVVIHLAALVRRLGLKAKPHDFYDANVNGTANICRLVHEKEVQRFIHISSIDVHGPLPRNAIPISEDYPFNPTDPYEFSKAEAEKVVSHYHKTYGLNAVVLRPAYVYGDGDKGYFSTIVKTVKLTPIVPVFGDGRTIKHFIHIDDLTKGIILAINRGRPGKAYFLADREPITIIGLLELVCRKWSLRRKFLKFPISHQTAMKMTRIIPERFKPIIAWFYRNYGCSIKASQQELGFMPRISLQKALCATFLSEENMVSRRKH